MRVFASKSSKGILKQLCLVVGGGSEIDSAKIYAKLNNKKLYAMPTTASGASMTSHSVVWTDRKTNVKTDIPITILPPVKIKLSKSVRKDTELDCLCHALDVMQKMSDNDLITFGTEVGRWLEKYGSGLTHKKSYAIKIRENITHGQSLRRVIIPCIEQAYPIK